MNCPYCKARIAGMTGYQEAENFRKHLNRCRQSPAFSIVRRLKREGLTAVRVQPYDLKDALEIRASSGQ